MKVPDCPVCLLFWIDREPVLITYYTCSTRVKITKLCMPAEANKLQVKKNSWSRVVKCSSGLDLRCLCGELQSAAPTNWAMWSVLQGIKHLWVSQGRSEWLWLVSCSRTCSERWKLNPLRGSQVREPSGNRRDTWYLSTGSEQFALHSCRFHLHYCLRSDTASALTPQAVGLMW